MNTTTHFLLIVGIACVGLLIVDVVTVLAAAAYHAWRSRIRR